MPISKMALPFWKSKNLVQRYKFCNEIKQVSDRTYQVNHCSEKVVAQTLRKEAMTISTEQKAVNPDEINKAHGHTVDGEGLLNNYAIEPVMYVEHGSSLSELTNRVTVVDIFDSEEEANTAVLSMEQKGILVAHISIIAKDYKNPHSSINWENITAAGGLAEVLTKLAISDQAISRFVEAIDAGKFLVIEIGNDREASQVQHVLEKAGHSIQGS